MSYLACSGSGQPPTVRLQNDWWVGPTVVCPVCRRVFKPTKQDTLPRHRAQS